MSKILFLALGIVTIFIYTLFASASVVIQQPTPGTSLTILNTNITNFTNLLDVPGTYVGSANKCVAVNAGATGLSFVTCASSGTYNSSYDAGLKWFYNQTYSGSTYNSTYAASIGNASWNQSYATTLYALIKWNYNQSDGSYNSTYATWAYNQTYSGSTYNVSYHGSLNNASYLSTYNSTYAANAGSYNATYAPWAYNQSTAVYTMYNNQWNSTYNITYQNWNKSYADTLYAAVGTGGNSSWNQSLATTLYANIIWGYNQTYSGSTYNATYAPWAYNQSTAVYTMYNNQWNSTYNITYQNWNKSYADTLYAAVGTGGNSSWNQSLATTLYANIIWGYNQTYSGSTYNATYAGSVGNASWNESYADTTLADIKWGYNYSLISGNTYNVSYAGSLNNASYLSTYNVSYAGSLNNASYLSTYNSTYTPWAYNQSDGSFNITYQNWNKSYADTLYSSAVYPNQWLNSSTLTYLNTSYPQQVNITNNFFVNSSNIIMDKDSVYPLKKGGNILYSYIYGTDANTGASISFLASRGTVATPTALQAGDAIGAFTWRGYDGTMFGESSPSLAVIGGYAGSNWNATSKETYFIFSTTPNNSITRGERMRITGSGNVGIGTTTPQAKLEVAGNVNVSTNGNITMGGGLISWNGTSLIIKVS